MAKKNNGSSIKPATSLGPVPTPAIDPASLVSNSASENVVLSAERYGGLRDIKARMEALAPVISDLSLQAEIVRRRLSAATGEYLDLDQRLGESIRSAAKENGVQLEGQSWNFNIPTLTFTRM